MTIDVGFKFLKIINVRKTRNQSVTQARSTREETIRIDVSYV